jgi:hypothetical protein
MKYELMLRSRANPREPIEAKHKRFFSRLREMPQPWGIAGHEPPPAPDCGTHIAAGATISKLLGKGIRGQVYYQYRYEYLEDIGMYDDFVDLSFDPRRVDYRQLVLEALPAYIHAFEGYLARIEDDAFFDADFPKERELRMDDRHFVYRVHPVSFYDATLCKRAFGLSPKQVADRLYGRIEDVRLIHNGVYLIGSSAPLEFEQADRLSQDMKRWIMSE